jgi:hypothetical protein
MWLFCIFFHIFVLSEHPTEQFCSDRNTTKANVLFLSASKMALLFRGRFHVMNRITPRLTQLSKFSSPALARVDSSSSASSAEIDLSAIMELRDKLTPPQTVALLDSYIIGQPNAKKAVAIAMRNRWRRQKLPEDLRAEVFFFFSSLSVYSHVVYLHDLIICKIPLLLLIRSNRTEKLNNGIFKM